MGQCERASFDHRAILGALSRIVSASPERSRHIVRVVTGPERDSETLAVLFDIDGTLISSGGAGTVAWREAFQDLYGVPADIGKFSDAGLTDPQVGRLTFEAVLGRPVEPRHTLVVGDTPLDIQAAHGAGARGVGVATGHYSVDQLRDAGADSVVETLEEELPL